MGQSTTGKAGNWIKASSADFIDDPDLNRLFDYWCARRQGRLMPRKADIDPLEIAWALSRIYLLDCTPSQEFVYRLAGNEVAGVFGRTNLKGLQPRDFLSAERAASVEKLFKRVSEDRCIMWMKGLIYLRADRTPTGERLFLPLSDSGDDVVTGVLGMTVVHMARPGASDGMEFAKDMYLPVSDIP